MSFVMTNLFNTCIWPCLLIACSLMTGALLIDRGLTPLTFALMLVTCLILAKLVSVILRSRFLVTNALKALANNDRLLGLSFDQETHVYFENIREKFHKTRSDNYAQNQLLKEIISNIDSGIIVANEQLQVIHNNTASNRLLGKDLIQINLSDVKELKDLITSIPSATKSLLSLNKNERREILSVSVHIIYLQGYKHYLISLQSITKELNFKENQAYKRLVRVLTHEISNSILPLQSMSDTCLRIIGEMNLGNQSTADLTSALQAISRRSTHLNEFVKQYSKISRLPAPQFRRVNICQLVQDVITLYNNEFKTKSIALEYNNRINTYWLMTDPAQLEQVLINLIVNAIEAVEQSSNKRLISISITLKSSTNLILDIIDSGQGVEDSSREQIFVPFFTTKPNGSGIGLALAKQIMINLGGDLVLLDNVKLRSNQGAGFRIIF